MLKKIINKDDIPIIEKAEGGYIAKYKNGREEYHQNFNEELNFMANSILKSFQEKKKAESQFISLAEDGEKISGIVEEIKQLSKVGFGGQEVEVIRLVLETADGIKFFDKGTKQWVDDLIKKEVDVGSSITITRRGEKGDKKTTYEIIKNK